jgi:hypothetical protein
MNNRIPPFIEPTGTESPDQNFARLRAEGIEKIQQYAADTWTDHNYHDPGITGLEAICYALTEQGHLNNLSISDLFNTLHKTGSINDFFDRGKVLFNAPVTILDWKKWLIDLDTVRNAWLLPLTTPNEPHVYIENNQYNLASGLSVSFNGLYNVLLEWSSDPVLGDINGNIISIPLTLAQPNGILKTYWADLIFPFTWDTTDPGFKAFMNNMALVSITLNTANPLHPQLDPEPGNKGVYFSDLVIVYDVINTVTVSVILRIETETSTNLEQMKIENAFISLLSSLNGPVDTYNKMMVKAFKLSLQAKDFLMEKRNISEDFIDLLAVKIQEIGIECELELTPGSEVEPLLAELFFVLDAFISPDFGFKPYTDAEITEENNDEWEGPGLVHGSIASEELEKAPGRSIFISDLLHLILDGQGNKRNEKIIAVFNLSLQSYIDNYPTGKSEENCIRLLDDFIYRPRLSIFKSQIKVKERGVDIPYNISVVYEIYTLMKKSVVPPLPAQSITAGSDDSDSSPEFPSYYPVQFEFPSFYQLRVQDKTPVNTQMRGYLFFFEQLLANQLSLLKHSTELLSVTNTQVETRFPANIRTLLPFYDDYLSADYETAMATEHADNNSRKSLLLDHLIARMGEDFRYFSIWNKLTGSTMNNAKFNFLSQLPDMAPLRYGAFNYKKAFWNTANIPAVHKKLVHLLQLPDALSKKRWKTPLPNFTIITIAGPITLFGFRITDALNNPLLKSPADNFESLSEAQDAATSIIQFGRKAENYQVQSSGILFRFVVLNDELDVIAISENTFATVLLAQGAIAAAANYFLTLWLPEEGLHILELILLRPQLYATPGLTDSLLHIPVLPDNRIVPGFDKDLYSQQVLVVLPNVGDRFGKPAYQEVATAVIQREFPASLKVRVVWLNIFKMDDFETAYEQWLNAIRNPAATELMVQSAKDKMIKVVNDIYSWLAETL